MILCHICEKSFSNKSNLYRHLRNVHGESSVQVRVHNCAQCSYSCSTQSDMKSHIQTVHKKEENLCVYCGEMFPTLKGFNTHLRVDHSLPTISVSRVKRSHLPEKSAFNGTAETFFLSAKEDDFDFLQFMIERKSVIKEIVDESLERESRKLQFSSNLVVEKPSLVAEDRRELPIYVNSKLETVYLGDGLSDETFCRMLDQMLTSLVTFTTHGSGWVFKKIIGLNIRLVSHVPIRGSSYIALPPFLENMKCLLNIRNHGDNNCFIYCYVAAWHFKFGPSLHENVTWRMRTSPETYNTSNELAHQPLGEYEMPMGFNQIPRFEKANKVQVNVFQYRQKNLIPILISKQNEFRFVLDLLLVTNGQTHHYVLIKDLKVLVNKIRGLSPRAGSVICRNCFHICSSDAIYQRHISSCREHDAATIIMPDSSKNQLHFKNLQSKWFVPFVFYFDFESLIKPVQRCTNNPEQSYSDTLEHHEPCGFCLVAVELNNPKPVFIKVERSENCMKSFAELLQQLAKDVYGRKQQNRYFTGQAPDCDDTVCWLCEQSLEPSDKVLDHCHATGQFLGFAHSKCNLRRRTVNYIPVVAHNLSNYDLHHICKNLHYFSDDCRIQVIPLTDEKYISLSIGVKVETYLDSRGVEKNVYEYLRFIDSYRFMASSLDKLVSFLPRDRFTLLDLSFPNRSPAELELLYQKGHYPYSYFDSHSKFNENRLPTREVWGNSLHGGKVTISAEEIQHAEKVFTTFNCENLGDFHDLYLTCDTLQLACVFEEFRRMTYSTYGLDSAHYFTCSNLSGDAFLKVSNTTVELLTDREHLEIAENLIRGGVASVFSKRLCTMNNEYLSCYDEMKASTYGIMLDANNLYGGIMEKFPLPLKDFQIDTNTQLSEILATSNDSNVGYIIEVDLEYPDALHNLHKDFPLAPTKEKIENGFLSNYQLSLLQKFDQKRIVTQKLVQTLGPKQNYTVHYITLKLYVNLGLKVTKVHRVLRFTQSKWMEPYITLNTKLRAKSTNKFQESFFKLMNNSCYGKTLESKRNRVNVKLLRSREAVLTNTDKHLCKSIKIFDENLVAITSRRSQILWDTPTIVGACILDLAKYHMFQFHYKVGILSLIRWYAFIV